MLTNLDGDKVKPFISAYLLLMGLLIVWKALTKRVSEGTEPSRVAPLGFIGGLLDSIGGGGWGPIVTSTLIGQGTTPRYAIGSVNLAEFFVTLTISATFVATIGLELWPIISRSNHRRRHRSPFAAYATKMLPDKVLMILVGCVVAILSLRTIVAALT